MRPNGLIIIDNVLWNGAIVEDESVKRRRHPRATRNQRLRRERLAGVEAVMVAVADGLTIVRKSGCADRRRAA